MVTTAFRVIVALGVSLTAVQGADQAGNDGAITARFRQAVEKDFVAYVEALNRYLRSRPPERRGSHPEPPNEVDQVFQRFEDAVIKNWPFAVPGAFPAQGGKSPHVALEAAEAFKAAARFESEQYLEGKAPRDRAVAEWVSVADRFPGTPEHDQALIRAAVLCTQRLIGNAKYDPAAERKLVERLASRPGPPSASTLMAEEELAAIIEDPARRWEVRGKLMEDVRRKQQDIEWLKANLLVPTDRTTPRQFAHGIVGVLYQLEGIQGTTGHGMEFDKSVGATKPPPITVPEPQPEPIPEGLSPGGIVLLAISGVLLIAFLAGPWLRRRLRRPPEGKA
jgi:hypothetical protein